MARKIKGVTTIKSYACSRCNQRYSTMNKAKECFDKGLPKILKAGTIYSTDPKTDSEDNNYFAIYFLSGRPANRTHQRTYVVGSYPERGYELLYATASFDGEFLHSIAGEHSKGGAIELGIEKATRIELDESKLQKLLENKAGFREFYEKTQKFVR